MDMVRRVAADSALATALAVVSAAAAPAFYAHHPSLLAFHLLLTAPLALRRVAPVPVFAAVVLIAVAQYLATPLTLPGDVALLVALYTVAANHELRGTLAAGSVIGLLAGLQALRFVPHEPSGRVVLETTVGVGGVVIAACMIGAYVRSRRAYLAALEDRAVRLEREREQSDQLAVARERARIAREMHDVVTHSLSVMVTLADGARASAGPGRTADVIGMVAATGRQALADMRRFLNVLRDDEPDALRHPQPGVAELDGLAGRVRAAGLPVRLRIEGDASALSAAVQLTVYRLVQESLTNTLRHCAPGARASVLVRRADGHVDVEVRDDGRPARAGSARAARAPEHADGAASAVPHPADAAGREADDATGPSIAGHGVEGMRDRVAAYRGTFEAGPLAGGGWRVGARLPLAETVPAAGREPGP